MAQPTIYYVRHGQTDWNAELRFQGRQDIALNEKGRRQAAANGRKLRSLVGNGDGFGFLTGPLSRTRETMEIMLGEMGRDPKGYAIEPLLVEASYGELEGTTLAEFKKADPQGHKRRKAERWTYCPAGGESHEMAEQRIAGWLDALDEDTVIAGHGVIGRVMRRRLLGIPKDEAAAFVFPQDVVFIWHGGREKQV